MGGGLVALQSIRPLKKGTRTFNFNLNEPSPDILGTLSRYDHPWKKTNKHACMIFLMDSTFLQIGS